MSAGIKASKIFKEFAPVVHHTVIRQRQLATIYEATDRVSNFIPHPYGVGYFCPFYHMYNFYTQYTSEAVGTGITSLVGLIAEPAKILYPYNYAIDDGSFGLPLINAIKYCIPHSAKFTISHPVFYNKTAANPATAVVAGNDQPYILIGEDTYGSISSTQFVQNNTAANTDMIGSNNQVMLNIVRDKGVYINPACIPNGMHFPTLSMLQSDEVYTKKLKFKLSGNKKHLYPLPGAFDLVGSDRASLGSFEKGKFVYLPIVSEHGGDDRQFSNDLNADFRPYGQGSSYDWWRSTADLLQSKCEDAPMICIWIPEYTFKAEQQIAAQVVLETELKVSVLCVPSFYNEYCNVRSTTGDLKTDEILRRSIAKNTLDSHTVQLIPGGNTDNTPQSLNVVWGSWLM